VKKRFDKYEILERIGVGGMAEVYLAKSHGAEGLEKRLVIKRILPELSSNPRFVDMFIAEARIAMALNHPNIVQIYDFGKVDEDFYIAMEHVEGVDLGQIMSASTRDARHRMSVGDAVYVALELAKGLDYAHRRRDHMGEEMGLVHRDISPQNVLVSREGMVKIVDFGIAKVASLDEENPGLLKGKFCYMSPEQASGLRVDARSDLFSAGVVLFEMVCNRPLFTYTTKDETLSLVKSAIVPDVSGLAPDAPADLERVIYKALARDVGERHQSARELQQDLARVLYGLDDIHDSYTLAEHVGRVEEELLRRGDAPVVSSTQSTRVARTSAAGATVAAEPASSATTVPEMATPVTPALDVEPSGERVVAARERKEALVLAGTLEGLYELRAQVGQERWLQVFQEYTRMVDALAFKNNGVVHRVNESGFMILLGVPVSSDNEAERAARTAMDLQDAMAGINLSLQAPLALSVGVAIGEVMLEHVSVGGGARRYSWSFLGDSEGFADRLARAGMAREIMLGGQVYRRIRRGFECEQVDTVALGDGQAQAMAYRLVGPKSPEARILELQSGHHAFFGRELELRSLRAAYRETLIDGVAQCVLVTGEQGVGKSAFVEEFLRGLDPRDVRVVRGMTNAFDRDIPLGGMSALLTGLLRLGTRDDLRHVRATLGTRIDALFPEIGGSDREMVLHSIGSIFNIRYPDGAFDELAGEDRRRRTLDSLRRLLKRFAEKKPVVIAIEDAQYIDAMTLELTTRLFEKTQDAPLLLVMTLTAPAGVLPPGWSSLEGGEHIRRLALEEMSPGEARALISEMLRGEARADAEFVEAIHQRSRGNPFYIREVIEALRDRGVLEDAERRRALKLAASEEWLPASVEGALASRLDRLALELRSTLQRVALLWTPFSGEDVVGLFGEAALEDVEQLAGLELLERVGEHRGVRGETYEPTMRPPAERSYRFVNALTQELAARALPADVAAQVHARLAERLDAKEQPGVMDKAMLARHLEGAGQVEDALRYYYESADEAFELFGAAESLRLCRKVLERAGEAETVRFEALRLEERALRELGDVEGHEESLDALVELARVRGDDQEIADGLLRLARYHYDQSDFKEAERVSGEARELAERAGLDREVARASLIVAYVRMDSGEWEKALESVDEAIAGFERAGAREEVASCHNTRGVALRRAGRYRDAIEAYERALGLLESPEASQMGRYLLMNKGLALVYVGRFDEALGCYHRVLERTRELGLRRDEAGVLINMGHAYGVLGDLRQALSYAQRGVYLARRSAAVMSIADGQITLGMIYKDRGERDVAASMFAEGSRLAESIPHVYLGIHAMLGLAGLKVESGEESDARVALMQAEDCLERAERASMRWGVANASAIAARAWGVLGDRDKALEYADRALELVDEGEEYGAEVVLHTKRALLEGVEGAREERDELARRAREVIEARAAGITDPELRAVYLAKPLHAEIIEAAEGA
jgi:serine/threonine protein kinase/predicted ATPase